jgi:hypothetical protein
MALLVQLRRQIGSAAACSIRGGAADGRLVAFEEARGHVRLSLAFCASRLYHKQLKQGNICVRTRDGHLQQRVPSLANKLCVRGLFITCLLC